MELAIDAPRKNEEGKVKMYSPKIKEDLIPKLYRVARKKGVPMTELVDDIIREALENEYQADRKGVDGGKWTKRPMTF